MESLFKVGQKVHIKPRGSDNDFDYDFSYVDGMTKYANKVVTIIKVRRSYSPGTHVRKYSKFYDGFEYKIYQDFEEYAWSSPMFKETYEL